MIVTLPWPDKALSPNARLHWRAKVGPKQDAKRRAAWLTIAAPGFHEARSELAASEGKFPVRVTFYPPDKRLRDDDNMVGSFKSWRDGIADALRVDDRRFKPEYHFADAEKPGRIEVELFTYLCTDRGMALGGIAESCLVNGDRPNSEAIK